jgi:hypothetical protein
MQGLLKAFGNFDEQLIRTGIYRAVSDNHSFPPENLFTPRPRF